ncbi:Exosome complex component rrp4 [Microbotryomycetes sp. JL221]|nr:Exosome complex component rrp4 [Microbotryomycetes sp. JL221]
MFRITTPGSSRWPVDHIESSHHKHNTTSGLGDNDNDDDDSSSQELDVTQLQDDTMLVDDEDDDNNIKQNKRMHMLAMPGQHIADKNEWMRGHGTYVHDDQVVASVAGSVERVNKLVSVRPLRTRYRPEVGDLVIGRIVEVGPRRWKVEAHAAQHAVLMLSSINLPGGVQRRKLESDELQMRNFFQEGDLLVAEVQAFFADGAMSLHTRSLKYGKLKNGTLVVVSPSLVLRLKSHFHTLSYGVDLIIGLNGYIWVSKTLTKARGLADDGGFGEESSETVYSSENEDISPKTRLVISRTSVIISLLAKHCVPISADLIAECYTTSLEIDQDDNDDKVAKLSQPQMGFQLLKQVANKRRQLEQDNMT